jgi:hypothetical protein
MLTATQASTYGGGTTHFSKRDVDLQAGIAAGFDVTGRRFVFHKMKHPRVQSSVKQRRMFWRHRKHPRAHVRVWLGIERSALVRVGDRPGDDG